MHVFLCGPSNIGKSTIIQNTVKELNLTIPIHIGGFVTYPGMREDKDIYLCRAWGEKKYEPENRVATRDSLFPYPFPQVFNTLGVSILEESKAYKNLLCMDELGFIEQNAYGFQNAVLQCLEENTPILGVVKESPVPWLDQIKRHSKAKLIYVSLNNRNEITHTIVKILKSSIKRI